MNDRVYQVSMKLSEIRLITSLVAQEHLRTKEKLEALQKRFNAIDDFSQRLSSAYVQICEMQESSQTDGEKE